MTRLPHGITLSCSTDNQPSLGANHEREIKLHAIRIEEMKIEREGWVGDVIPPAPGNELLACSSSDPSCIPITCLPGKMAALMLQQWS